ncbi:APC family permease [Hyphomicrobium sp.]|uniref:APC family permease n=1 Tax=Hyphomicrobium sp. TaxID=82 RepID=UPI0025C33176|nr:APC family permease [Hyphomicrobium sp.]
MKETIMVSDVSLELSPIADVPVRSTGTTRLRGNLGVWQIVFMVTAAASPLGVLGGTVIVGIGTGNGTGFPATYIVTGIALLLFAIGFTAMTPYVRTAGAFYAYIDKGLGRSIGLSAGLVALLSYIAVETGCYGLIGPGIDNLLQSWGFPSAPWWVYAFGVFAVVTYFGYRNIELSGKVLAVGLLAEVAICLVFDAVVIARGGDSGLSTGIISYDQVFSGAPGVGILFAILSFLGFEATAVFRDEARDPERTIKRATYSSLILITVFYAVSSWALITAVGDQNAVKIATENSGTMLSDATHRYLGPIGFQAIQVLFVTSLFACILSFHNIVSRYVFVLSERNVFPKSLGVAHSRHYSPHRASIATSIVVAALVILGAATNLDPINQFYTWLGGFSAVGVVLLYTLASLAVVVFFARHREHTVGIWRGAIAPGLGFLTLAAFFGLVLQNLKTLVGGSDPLAVTILALLIGAFVLGPILAKLRPKLELE